MTRIQLEQYSDELDRASALQMEAAESAITNIQHACRRQQEERADGSYEVTECRDCGNDIGEGRLRAAIKNMTCIHCATFRETGRR